MREHEDTGRETAGDENGEARTRLRRTPLERLNLVAVPFALILLLGALGYRAGLFESSSASAYLGRAGGEATAQAPGGCGPGGCASAPAGARRGGCGGPGGGCGSGSGPVDIEALKRSVADAYRRATGETGFDVEIKDLGCHQEAEITKNGKKLKRLAVSGGRLYEIN